ncbi:MAG TPA: aminotransferase class V-fold PLP-dependent enzyme [Longimicrobiales bacterium]|nr:aminotransferase class V-fold PLP-dependent enzyme [Longimicrobiales bacterium]
MDWNAWRDEFPILSRKTYLNSCSLGALGRRAQSLAATFQDEWSTWGAAAWYEIWMSRLAELRRRVAGLLGAAEAEVALEPSTSVALAAIASALDYRRRPRIVVSELDFPTLAYQWMVRTDAEVVSVPSDDGTTIDPQRFADAVDERTSLLATSHVFFTTGAIQDLRTLADIAHARGALLLVDAYQSAGQVPIDVRRDDVDILTTGPLKWLLGGPGLAYLYVREALWTTLRPSMAGWFGAREQFEFDISRFEFKEDARRFELGTPALPSVHFALGGQEVIDAIGVHAIRERNRMLTERLVAGAEAAGLRMRHAADPEARSAIVMIADADPAGAVAHLATCGIIVDWRPGFVRVSPHFYNTEDEMDQVVRELVTWRG